MGCICHSSKFYLRCLRKSHLEYLQIFRNMQRPTGGISSRNRKLRQTSHQSFIACIYGFSGPKKREPIPACVVQKVRSSYPEPKGRYRGFLQPFDYNTFHMALDSFLIVYLSLMFQFVVFIILYDFFQ
ncbi:hypothetical protein XELAEV_18032655mg [Xenopus laevis]|uniref:P2X purinoreceptor 7 intracellular domain-containing protein n=1 Tax=Xenopus laevis TaxID=8355 RepID=A0A974CIV2_XENLA|nr:hypothetical protein XELAEV_18032655mg [Xenopus laevis]